MMELLWLGAGLLSTRWTVGEFLSYCTSPRRPDDADKMMMVFIWVLTLGVWPAWWVFYGGRVVYRLAAKAPYGPLGKGLRWFYTLDRQKRKQIFNPPPPAPRRDFGARSW